jgi:phosphopantetheinyl transferase
MAEIKSGKAGRTLARRGGRLADRSGAAASPRARIEVLAADLEEGEAALRKLLALAGVADPGAGRSPLRRRRVAEAILRVELGRRLGLAPREVAIARSGSGKPYLAPLGCGKTRGVRSRTGRLPREAGRLAAEPGRPPAEPGRPPAEPGRPPAEQPLRFSLAHSGRRALIALSGEHEVGVDLEPIDLRRPHERLARRWFTAAEHKLIAACATNEDRARAFYRLWTAKEACVKATGEGLAALGAVEICGEQAFWLHPRLGSARWRVQQLDLGPGWAAAVAAPGLDWRATLNWLRAA